MALKTISQSTHPAFKTFFHDFAKEFFGYKPTTQEHKPKILSATKRYRIRRQFDLRKPDRFPVMMPLLILLAVMFLMSWLIHYFLQSAEKQLKNGGLGNAGDASTKENILFVVAHPDDEAMFFAPSVIRLTAADRNVHLLCLTTGNYYGKGEKRKSELKESARILGVDAEKVHVVDDSELQDSNQRWDIDKTAAVIRKYVQLHNIQLILTFDEFGVSGHINHRSLYYAVRDLISQKVYQSLLAYKLESTNVIRKYASLLDLMYSWWSCDGCLMFVSSWSEVAKSQDAMRAHASQYVWFRKLYIRASRYMIMNTLKPIRVVTQQTDKHAKTS